MKKFLILAVVLLMMAPAAFGKNMVEGKFGAGLSLGTGQTVFRAGNALGLGINLQYGITGLTFQGVFNYSLGLQPESFDTSDFSESTMDFGVNFLGTVGDGSFVGYAGLGFFYYMRTTNAGGEGEEDFSISTYGLNLTSAVDYFLNDMIALGFQIGYPISLGSDNGVEDDDYEGMANIAGSSYKVTVKFFF